MVQVFTMVIHVCLPLLAVLQISFGCGHKHRASESAHQYTRVQRQPPTSRGPREKALGGPHVRRHWGSGENTRTASDIEQSTELLLLFRRSCGPSYNMFKLYEPLSLCSSGLPLGVSAPCSLWWGPMDRASAPGGSSLFFFHLHPLYYQRLLIIS
jgi:hypothetical protein